MRRTDHHDRRPVFRRSPGRDAPPATGRGRAAVADAPSLAPDQLRARAEDVLDRLCGLEREMLGGRTPTIGRIDAIATSVCDLQTALAHASAERFGTDDVTDLRRAQSCIGEALVLTIDLLARSPEF